MEDASPSPAPASIDAEVLQKRVEELQTLAATALNTTKEELLKPMPMTTAFSSSLFSDDPRRAAVHHQLQLQVLQRRMDLLPRNAQLRMLQQRHGMLRGYTVGQIRSGDADLSAKMLAFPPQPGGRALRYPVGATSGPMGMVWGGASVGCQQRRAHEPLTGHRLAEKALASRYQQLLLARRSGTLIGKESFTPHSMVASSASLPASGVSVNDQDLLHAAGNMSIPMDLPPGVTGSLVAGPPAVHHHHHYSSAVGSPRRPGSPSAAAPREIHHHHYYASAGSHTSPGEGAPASQLPSRPGTAEPALVSSPASSASRKEKGAVVATGAAMLYTPPPTPAPAKKKTLVKKGTAAKSGKKAAVKGKPAGATKVGTFKASIKGTAGATTAGVDGPAASVSAAAALTPVEASTQPLAAKEEVKAEEAEAEAEVEAEALGTELEAEKAVDEEEMMMSFKDLDTGMAAAASAETAAEEVMAAREAEEEAAALAEETATEEPPAPAPPPPLPPPLSDEAPTMEAPIALGKLRRTIEYTGKHATTHVERREALWRVFDQDGNGYISRVECCGGMFDALCDELGEAEADRVYRRYHQNALRAYQGCKEVVEMVHPRDDEFIARSEFRLLLVSLCAFATCFEVFMMIKRSADDSSRLLRSEWVEALPAIRSAGRGWADSVTLADASEELFDRIDDSAAGSITVDEFCSGVTAEEEARRANGRSPPPPSTPEAGSDAGEND
jgi:hypothetical protein